MIALFLRKAFYFSTITTLVLILLYVSLNQLYNHKEERRSLFIFGDSQTYQGIDIKALEKKSTKTVWSASRHGAGVYDFHVFSSQVPNNAIVIIGLSKSMLLREKEKDFNRLGLSLTGLTALYQHGYTGKELMEIVDQNILPKEIYKQDNALYPNDKMAPDSLLKKIQRSYQNVFTNKPSYLENKMSLFSLAIERLKQKNCQIICIEFPYHEQLQLLEKSSSVGKELNRYFDHLIETMQRDTLRLNPQKQNMFDMTHLNGQAAASVSQFIIDGMQKEDLFISINAGVSK